MKLEQIKQNMLTMGQLVQTSLNTSVQALISREKNNFLEVHRIEKEINKWHIQLDT